MAALLIPFLVAILAKFVALASWIAVLSAIVFACAWLLGTDFAKWAFEQLLDLLIFMLKDVKIDFKFLDPNSYVTIPPEVMNFIGLCGLDSAMAIILSAIIIKITLQLIPFTRLGS